MTLFVGWLWQGIAIAALASVLVSLVSARAAERRHRVWWLALALVMALPLIELAEWLLDRPVTGAPIASEVTPLSMPADAPAGLLLESPPASMLVLVAGVWAVFFVVSVLRLVLGWIAVRRLVATSRPLGAREQRLSIWNRLRTAGRRPALRVTPHVRGACAVGLRRPTILISSDVASRLSDEQLEHVVLHELAHIDRYDDWSTLAHRAVLSVAGFHPAVRWIARRIELEMEAACDQRVVGHVGSAAEYAHSLLDVARLSARSSPLRSMVAPGSSTHMPDLRARISRLASAGSRSTIIPGVLVSGACMATLTVTALILATRPALVAFEDVSNAGVPLVSAPPRIAGTDLVRPLSPRVMTDVEHMLSPAPPAARAVPPVVTQAAGPLVSQPAPDESTATSEVAAARTETAESPATPAAPVEPEPLSARAISPAWAAPRAAAVDGKGSDRSIGNMAQRSAAGITRAAQSTAGAFTRFGLAVASKF